MAPLEDGFVFLGIVPPGELGILTRRAGSHCGSFGQVLYDYASSMRYLFENDPSDFGEG